VLCAALLLSGCATISSSPSGTRSRPFIFGQDTFAFANELVWEYRFDERGEWISRPREPKPDYTHRCFVVVCAVKQFFHHARFDPGLPRTDPHTYRRLIRSVLARSPRTQSPAVRRIVIPGYANLREFSAEREGLLKAECGGAWQSYFQRGHWRIIWPFSRRHQEKTAQQLVEAVQRNQAPIVHLICFPSLRINHSVQAFEVTQSEGEINFGVYDPNAPDHPSTLTYDRAARTFRFPVNFYFPGGRVDVYQIYHRWCY
jgi:hypothetical protein